MYSISDEENNKRGKKLMLQYKNSLKLHLHQDFWISATYAAC